MDPVTALFGAIAGGDAESAEQIAAANPELARAKNADTLSVLQFARYMKEAQILERLIAAGPPLDLFEASQLDVVARVSELLSLSPAIVNTCSVDGFTALHFAAYYGATSCVNVLLEASANTEAVTTNFLENMPIHAAAAGRRPETLAVCELLLNAGANVNAKQHGGFTPLHTPAQHGDRELAELFLSHGADASTKNDDGKTPADLAASQGNIELAALLRSREAGG